MRSVKIYPESWPLHAPFAIARGTRTEAQVVVVELEQDGIKGTGECTPYPRYGENTASVLAQISLLLTELEQGMTREALQYALPAGAARNAVDCALWDLECRQRGVTLCQALKVTLPAVVPTAQTVVIDTPENMASSAQSLWQKGASLLKIKLDDRLVTERVTAIRLAVPEAQLIVDANESWSSETLPARCERLAKLNIAMLEQPLPAKQDEMLARFHHPLPICADESCHTRADLAALCQRYEMVNIKLDKTGGLTEALRLADAAHAAGFAIMLGCMLCTSRAIASALPLVPRARFVDLDGPTWLAVDVEPGLSFYTGKIALSPAS